MRLHWVPLSGGTAQAYAGYDDQGSEIGRIVEHKNLNCWEWHEVRAKYWDAVQKRYRNIDLDDAYGGIEPTMSLAVMSCIEWLREHQYSRPGEF